MRLAGDTMLFVVGQDGVSRMAFGDLVNAFKGGTKITDIAVFTNPEEAEVEQKRRQLLANGIATLQRLDVGTLEAMVLFVAAQERAAEERQMDEILQKCGV
jgi:hypothetical protein